MSNNRKKILNALTSRLAMNIYFWALLILPNTNIYASSSTHVFSVLLYCQLIGLVYFNNLVLIPRFLVKKKYMVYFSIAPLAILIIAFSYTFTLKIAQDNYPDINLQGLIFFVNGTLKRGLSITSVFSEMPTYIINLLSLTTTFTLVWYVRDYFKQEKITDALKRKQLEIELNFLKGQINPHFLFNTLNNLYGLSIDNSEHTSASILKLSSILRYLMHESNVSSIAFEKEKEVMLAYIDLELLRLPKKDNMHFSISADKPYSIPPLLWLPVLENVFKHGTRFIDKDLMIVFDLKIENDRLTIYSKNKFSYKTRSMESERVSGIGLSNLKQRLAILYPGKYSMDTKQEDNYYIVQVAIDLK